MGAGVGIALRKGNPAFSAAVGKALDDARADRGLGQASLKWFGIDATRAP